MSTARVLKHLDSCPPLSSVPTWQELAQYGMTTVAEVKRDARDLHKSTHGCAPKTDADARGFLARRMRRAERRLRRAKPVLQLVYVATGTVLLESSTNNSRWRELGPNFAVRERP